MQAGSAVVDAANVAHLERTDEGKPKVANISAVKTALEHQGIATIVIADASLVHSVDDSDQLEELIRNQDVRQVPAGTDADYFILKTAEQQNAVVVSNDRYRERRDEFPWIDDRRIPVMIVEGEVQFYEKEVES